MTLEKYFFDPRVFRSWTVGSQESLCVSCLTLQQLLLVLVLLYECYAILSDDIACLLLEITM